MSMATAEGAAPDGRSFTRTMACSAPSPPGTSAMRLFTRVLPLMLLASLLSGCGYNAIQQKDEAVKASWSEVLNQYKRRADLVPNLVQTVKGFASQEERVLTEVTNARSRVGQINVNADDVWGEFGVTGEGITVANIDTGVQYDHPALVGKYRGNNGDGTFDHNYNWFNAAGSCSRIDVRIDFSAGSVTSHTRCRFPDSSSAAKSQFRERATS